MTVESIWNNTWFFLWFKLYITELKRFVYMCDKESEYTSAVKLIKFGVSQGSILWLLIVNIFINEIVENVNRKIIMYADDDMHY